MAGPLPQFWRDAPHQCALRDGDGEYQRVPTGRASRLEATDRIRWERWEPAGYIDHVDIRVWGRVGGGGGDRAVGSGEDEVADATVGGGDAEGGADVWEGGGGVVEGGAVDEAGVFGVEGCFWEYCEGGGVGWAVEGFGAEVDDAQSGGGN